MDMSRYINFVLKMGYSEDAGYVGSLLRAVCGVVSEIKEYQETETINELGDVLFWATYLKIITDVEIPDVVEPRDDFSPFRLIDLAEKSTRSNHVRSIERKQQDLQEIQEEVKNIFYFIQIEAKKHFIKIDELAASNHEKLNQRHG